VSRSGRDGSGWDASRALRYLLRLLTRRDFARAELEARLERKHVAPDVREAALGRLAELDLLDDRRMAESWVRSQRHRKGRLALARELTRRGLAEADREAALAPLDDGDQAAVAREVLAKQAWRFASGDRRRDAAKAAGFLRRRGFPGEVVREVVEDAFEPDDGGGR
jgi:regulatory protein